MAVCVVGALLNLALVKRRGISAALLSAAFVVLGFTIELYRLGSSKVLIGLGSVAVIGLVIGDFFFRQPPSGSRP